VIDIKIIPYSGRVLFGCTVELINLDTDETVVYRIVGDDEANIKENRISVNSPIARAMIGKEEGDVVNVKIPSGTVEYEIGTVKHI
jgi:transcription elongation factor GreA